MARYMGGQTTRCHAIIVVSLAVMIIMAFGMIMVTIFTISIITVLVRKPHDMSRYITTNFSDFFFQFFSEILNSQDIS
uniref:Uncharacterized protein n=1 Tax=Oryza brachyantha TaxID=4533 RepID=J3MWE8_ORYBR